jgi:hypothetical protein
MEILLCSIAVVLTIAVIFGRRVARWLVIFGVSLVVLFVTAVFSYDRWAYWSSGRMELDDITNRLLQEQAKYNLSMDQEIPLWRVEELARETQREMHQKRIAGLTQDQVTQIMQDQEARWKTWLASPECKLESLRYYRKNLGDVSALLFLKPKDKQILMQHRELLTNEERKLLEDDAISKASR